MMNKQVVLILLGFGGGLANAVEAAYLLAAPVNFQQFLWRTGIAVLGLAVGIVAALQLRKCRTG